MAGERILVVDDRRENILFLVNDILRPEGYEIITARDGEKGLEKALKESPDLIITDMQMPKMNGDEMIRALRKAGHTTPVILTTVHGSETAAIRAFRAGATDYVIKPFTVDEIFQAVERALSLRATPSADVRSEGPSQVPPAQELLERRLAEFRTLQDVGKAVTSLLDVEEILWRTVQAAVYLANAEEGHVMLVEPQSDEIYLRAAYSQRDRRPRSVRIRVGDSMTRQVVKSGRPIILKPPPGGDPGHKLRTGYLTKSMLAVPIKKVKEVIGVLLVDNLVTRTEFTEDDSRQLSVLADYAGIAISNARRYEQAEALSAEVPALEEAEIADCRAEAARLADQLRALSDEATRLSQRLQSMASSFDRPST
jgi:two-component system NtrC family sensor kinase